MIRALGSLTLALVLLAPAAAQQQPTFDLVIRGGTVVDGTGAPAYRADVAVRGDRIVRIDRAGIAASEGRIVLDARNLVVTPGFIDLHAHVEDLADRPLAESVLRQGITTVIYAPDGGMPWPLSAAIERLRTAGHAPNTAFFAGHNTIRSRVLGSANRAPSADELNQMKALTEQAMREGAIGLSTGLRYVPGIYSTTEEVIELARVAAAHGGFYA